MNLLKFLIEILDEWKKIGSKGEQLEKKWLKSINKKNPKIISELKNIYTNTDLNGLTQLIEKEKTKYFDKTKFSYKTMLYGSY